MALKERSGWWNASGEPVVSTLDNDMRGLEFWFLENRLSVSDSQSVALLVELRRSLLDLRAPVSCCPAAAISGWADIEG